MLTRSARSRGFGGRVGDAVLGSWTRTVSVAAAALVIFGIIGFLAATGSLGDLQYANIPLIHPYPPPGYFINPFGTSRADLVSSSEAAKVKNDLFADGRIELDALRTGDSSSLTTSTTGGALSQLQALIRQNAAAGVYEDETITVSSATVGRLRDPLDTSVTWMVEEKGVGTIRYLRRADGSLIRTSRVDFNNRFWLVLVGGRYLITDTEISSRPIS
jgi:hypothetical protein